jgi:hypothetical protein
MKLEAVRRPRRLLSRQMTDKAQTTMGAVARRAARSTSADAPRSAPGSPRTMKAPQMQGLQSMGAAGFEPATSRV